ncbi:UbiA family prenyltransferase [Streptomyces sp. NPDC057245]|uniref:UbiA family prenyltransferase n=1 Tax=Streptomyces sp. NPDC057245 TaxID=3346065 RepID=UPI00363F4588
MSAGHPPAGAITPVPKAVSYLRLGKARIYHYVYGWALGLVLLHTDGIAVTTKAAPLTLLLVGILAFQWSTSAADDVCGFLNGSDARNYADRPAITRVRKPLLTGALTLPEATRFAVVTWCAGLAALLLAAASLGRHVPVPALAVAVLTPAFAVQYSCGAKLSYRPLGLESTVLFTGAYTVFVPYWFVTATLSPTTLLVSALVGLWLLLVVAYGNASDRDGDRAVSRRTLAVILPPAWFAALLHLLVATNAVLLVLLSTTLRRPELILLTAPVTGLQLAQLYYGVYRRELRKARFLVLVSIDIGSVALAAALLTSRSV